MISASLAFTRPLISRLSVVFGIAYEYVRFQLCNMVSFVHSADKPPATSSNGLECIQDFCESIGSLLEGLIRLLFHDDV